MTENLFTIFILAVFLGFFTIRNIPNSLHSPLMSVTNTISGIVILGAIKIAGQTDNAFILFLSLSAIFLAAVNIAGGFTVSNRMLDFFKRKDKQ